MIERALSLDPAARFCSVRPLGAALLDFATPGVRARWQGMRVAEADAPAPARAPSSTLILPARGQSVVAVGDGDRVADVVLARSWTPRLILLGLAASAAIIATASAHRHGEDLAIEPAHEVARSSPARPSLAPRRAPVPLASAPWSPPPTPRTAAPPAATSPFAKAHHQRHHRRLSPQSDAPTRNGAPIIE